MSWLRVDDGFATHPKLLKLPRADRWTWMELLCYSATHRTDGAIPANIGEILRHVSPAFLKRCEAAELLDRDDAGELQIHDWKDYNPRDTTARERMRAYRERNALRNEERNDTVTSDGTDRNANGPSRAGARARPVPSRPVTNPQPQPHARANPDPNGAERAAAALEELGLSLPIDAGDEARVLAWCELARSEATSNPAGFVRSGIMRGEWPSRRLEPADGAVERRPIVDVARDIVRNLGALLEPGDLAAELADLERKRGERIAPAAAAELLELADRLRKGEAA